MHALPEFTAIEAGLLPLAHYGKLLSSLYRFHAAVGAAAEAGGLDNLSSAARRLPLLASDLATVGLSSPAAAVTPRSRPCASLLGMLYVAEGSMLGGRVIAQQLDYLFGTTAEGRRFFLGTREDGRSWRRLVVMLDTMDPKGDSLAALIDGAEAAFALFERCVSEDRQ
jgi:heme oxygenase